MFPRCRTVPFTVAASIFALGAQLLPQPALGSRAALRTIPLQKQYVPVSRGGRVIAYKTSYFGEISMGGPSPESRRPFTVVFDTGSGHLILPSTACYSETCARHRRFNRAASPTALDVEYDGTPIKPDAVERDQVAIAFGTGEVVGEFVEEAICVGSPSPSNDRLASPEPSSLEPNSTTEASPPAPICPRMRVVLATEMTADPFGLFVFDGVLGLGLEALTLDPGFSFFRHLSASDEMPEPRFSVFLARNDGGESEVSFGGYDERRATSELQWAPVVMQELGYWQVQLTSVRIGDTVLDYCADGTCRAILDTGTSLLGVPKPATRTMHRLLARPVKEGSYESATSIDCREVPGKDIHFELGAGHMVTLGVEDFSRPTPFNMTVPDSDRSQLFCRSLLLPVDHPAPLGPKVFIWGEPLLRRYYTVYDWAQRRVGFSPAAEPAEGAAGLPAVGAPPAGSLISGAPLAPLRRHSAPPPTADSGEGAAAGQESAGAAMGASEATAVV
jgi:hypothetical protein